MRRELVHPALTPARGIPDVPADLRPLPCPDGYALVPVRSKSDRLTPTQRLIVLHVSSEFLDGNPCVHFAKGRVGEELGKLIGKATRTTEDALKGLIAIGYFTRRDHLTERGVRTFLWANYALADELPELGGGPDRANPRCEVPHRPAFVLPGPGAGNQRGLADPAPARPEQAARPAASPPESAGKRPAGAVEVIPQRETCANLPEICATVLETCATETAPADRPNANTGEHVTHDPPGEGCDGIASRAQIPGPAPHYVYGLVPPPPEHTNTYAKSDSASTEPDRPAVPDPAVTDRPFINQRIEELLAYLARRDVFRFPIMYTPTLRELSARGVPWPERYAGKKLLEERPEPPASEVKRYPPPPAPAEKARQEATTLEGMIRGLHGSGDLQAARELACVFMERLGENPKNRRSFNFHHRNCKELATKAIPPEVFIDALAKFRSGGAERPRCVFNDHVTSWRKRKGLDAPAEARARERSRLAGMHPAERGAL